MRGAERVVGTGREGPGQEVKAAALISSLAQHHPLYGGDKRFSWILTLTFLELNGIRIDMDTDTAFGLVLGTAQSRLDLHEIAEILAAHVRARG